MTTGFGDFDTSCPGHKRHQWQAPDTENRCCEHCGTVASEFLDAATKARHAFYSTIRAPLSSHGVKKKQ
jgi:hypothetical protein